MKNIQSIYFTDRKDWRKWLSENFDKKEDIWLEYPKNKTGKKRILYNDAVEEALCFRWIDSTVKSLNESTTIQRFCKRRAKSSFSQPNIERLKWLYKEGLIHPSNLTEVEKIIIQEFIFPTDILEELKRDKSVWNNYQQFSDGYQRIRIAYIETARKRPEEFQKRLQNFIEKTRANKMIRGYGGVEKYY